MSSWPRTAVKQEMKRRLIVPLEEEEWRRFIKLHPDPVGWIAEQIRRSIHTEKAAFDR